MKPIYKVKLNDIIKKEDIWLYRDYGVGIFKNISRPEEERKMKPIVKVLEDCELSKVVDTNLKKVNFLDVIFDFEKVYTNLIKH